MKKLVALVLAGAMFFSMTAMAKEVGAPVANYDEQAAHVDPIEVWYWVDENGNFAGIADEIYPKDPTGQIPADIVVAAIEQDKLVDEYMNNAVTGIWAMDSVIPVAQGGNVIIDGAPSNQTFSVLKPELSRVYSAKDFAASIGGTVLNVVKYDSSVGGFGVANVNFYTPGITAERNVKVYQYSDAGWVEKNVTEVREDHVVVDLTSPKGVIAFIEVAAQ